MTTMTAEPSTLPESWTPELAWGAVTRRDASAREAFVYAVRSTGVYCRPGCPSRLPRRDNTRFFTHGEEARLAGYRACLRCRPDEPVEGADPLDRARAMLLERDEPVTLTELGRAVGLSPAHLQRKFKQRFGVSPRELWDAHREERLRALLRQDGTTVTRATYDAGFGSSSRVYERAATTLGMTPARYAQGGPGLAIRYTVVDSPLGRLLVAVTDRGVCAVSLGKTDEALASELREEFPRATLSRVDEGDEWLAGMVERVARAVSAESPYPGGPELPLELVGTVFQRRVWRALLEIPAGETRSYGQLAHRLGDPKATRAVARACASNRLAVIVPCHRVVRSDGSLGGYRWGLPTKQALLAREHAAAS
jgi:AraC family transcriptional regulator, regulatory protein of adaptative response / methylated-DNA-[protein]-cysteine methyltransferase